MKKPLVVFSAILFAFVFLSCNNGDNTTVTTETNPYPDGVYPFEVSNVGHTQGEEGVSPSQYWVNKYTFTWTNPSDRGFSRIYLELWGINTGIGADEMRYSSASGVTDGWEYGSAYYTDAVLGKNSFSINMGDGDDKFLIIKCVDRFGNISEGVRYEFEYEIRF